jgi:hypothetical protein
MRDSPVADSYFQSRWTTPDRGGKAGLHICSHTLLIFAQACENQREASLSLTYNVGELMSDATWGRQMHLALEINVALWGMIICAAMEAQQILELF